MNLPSSLFRRLCPLPASISFRPALQSTFPIHPRELAAQQYSSTPVTCHKMSSQEVPSKSITPLTTPSNIPRIHIIGLGNIGKLFAHSLARLSPPPPITLLLHRPELAQAFSDNGSSIDIITNGKSHKVTGFDIEVLGIPCEQHITNLIVATKATDALAAITAVRSRLGAQSSIVFAQNGKGTPEEVTAHLFPDPASRPAYLPTVLYHGLHYAGPFSCIFAGIGHLSISAPPNRPQARYILESILQAPALRATEATEADLLVMQLEKLAINAVLNPLTAIFRVLNGELFKLPAIEPLWRALTKETLDVVRAWQRTQGVEDGDKRFGFEAFVKHLIEKAEMTGKNKSSMLQDVEAGKELEIQYINGWIAARGRELSLETNVTEKVMKCLEGRRKIKVDEAAIKEEFGELV